MIEMKRILVGVAVALILCLASTSGEAAWWPWSKRTEKTAPAAPVATPTPPADVPAAGTPDPTASDGSNRLDTIEAEMRDLTGQIEQLTYQLKQVQDQLARLQGDTGTRPEPVDGGTAKPKKQAAVALPAPPVAGSEAPAARLVVPVAPAPMVAPADSDQPIDLGAVSRGTAAATPAPPAAPAALAPKTDVLAALGDPHADYDSAYNDILAGNYDRAEQQFRAFLSAHPDDARASDAQYWLGESLFARAKYREAALEFLNGHNAYPNSPKAPDTLLKLGLSLAGLGERDAACQTYIKVLKQYPQASKSLRQRVAVEQASASC
jgi:tol-pal system protein YbgF